MSYEDFKKKPGEHLREAERILLGLDPALFTNDAETIAYAQALVDLSSAQMTGSLRR